MTIFNKKFIVKHQDNYGEKNFEIVKGSYFLENLEEKYVYQSKGGICEISLKNKIITIKKDKNIFKISFDGKKNSCLYKNEIYEFNLFILGKEYSYDQSLKIFTIIYEVFDENNEKLNEINFSIKEI